ncbi:inositol hexakisphosphate and diphosphoinositol-pentakisphosphate kinase [Parastagonospora nodorum]|nr:inositol hexakisphosphate and diphosphoinositol-pentakisphosphate kinase [Parastagonospora nodorum]KAH6088433.1 inositol hexakisphosphate and diphosphoinositol-pentakisphosphate kinase [Parastagonospora nodorum]KAH6309629.1 inositol hexakisphosphate and diphosphoinositol-pentakisphosphate kinase [Parastagonospora nodorum]
MEHSLSRTASVESTRSWQQLMAGSLPADRKARSSEPETGGDSVGRASVSLPPSGSQAIRQLPQRRASKASDSILDLFGHARSSNSTNSTNGSAIDEVETTPTLEGTRTSSLVPLNALMLPDALRPPPPRPPPDAEVPENKRLSFSSLYSIGSAIYANTRGHSWSGRSSLAGSEFDAKMEGAPHTTTATSSLTVETTRQNGTLGPKLSPTQALFPQEQPASATPSLTPSNASATNLALAAQAGLSTQPRRSRSRTAQRRISGSTATSSSPASRDMREKKPTKGIIGVCALESKARSKPARNIFGKLVEEFDVKIFGDKIILDEAVENWPVCDFLISFFSDGFPLDKAIAYVRLRKPFCVNDLPMQQVLWDRRLCLGILDKLSVPTPRRIDVTRDGGPRLQSPEFAKSVFERTGLKLQGPEDGTGGGVQPPKHVELVDDGNTILVDGVTLTKPFVEKPVSGEDHNIHIYFHKKDGGGGRRLFRKVNNKSSEKDDTLEVPRSILDPTSSYIYEQFLQTENSEDVKAYTVGPSFCHAETRKSPVVDGLVKRNPSGKEVRYVTKLNEHEAAMASRISEGFGQRVCGFDLLRTDGNSFVIDVNGWSFVKDNGDYYDRAANILKDMFIKEIHRKQRKDAAQSAAADAQKAPEDAATARKSEHRKVFGKIFKSPSMSKMANHYHSSTHLPHMRHASTVPSSPEISLSTTPIAASPTTEKPNPLLGPPAIPPSADKPSSEPEISLPPVFDDADLHLEPEASQSEEQIPVPPPASAAQWKLKGVVAVVRHADRTPKQKFKYTFHSKPFVDLLKGHQAEVLLIGQVALQSVNDAVKVAMDEELEDMKKLRELQLYLNKKGAWPGTKVQIKPMFRKRKKEELLPGESLPQDTTDAPRQGSVSGEGKDATSATSDETEIERLKNRSDSMSGVTLSRITAQDNNMVLDKLQLIIKWGGEPTHSARHQTQDMGANFRNDLMLMNRDVLDDVSIFSSSERRVTTSAQIFGASFLDKDQYLEERISVRKDLLDDSNAAKDVMDKVKKKLKTLLRAGTKAPPQFAWPKDIPEPYIVARQVVDLMKFHQRVMNHNFKKIDSEAVSSLTAIQSPPTQPTTPGQSLHQHTNVNHIQSRWCCNEGPELFKERWEKLFKEFADADKVDPSKISELYDTMKFDALHNRSFLEWVFTPDATFVDEDPIVESSKQNSPEQSGKNTPTQSEQPVKSDLRDINKEINPEKPLEHRASLSHRMGFRRKSEIAIKPAPVPSYVNESYFKLYTGLGTAASKAQIDARLVKLREMYHMCKVLFDYIGPQEYGIESEEKLEIGLLTSLPLLKEIVADLEELQASDTPKCFFYFTKESHIYTLLNCILEGGIKTKIERNAIPELDYLSQINFELYESENSSTDNQPHTFNYSIRITLSPGCHAFAPLDVQLDSRHMIGFSPRRSLTAHQDWKEVLETLRAKFHTVKLPKSFVAIDLSQDSNGDRRGNGKMKENGDAKSEDGERGRSEERQDEIMLPIAGDVANIASPVSTLDSGEGREGLQPAVLPPPALDP